MGQNLTVKEKKAVQTMSRKNGKLTPKWNQISFFLKKVAGYMY